MTATITKTSGHPATDMSGMLSGTGLTAYLHKCAKHEVGAHDAYHEAAALLRRGIEKSGKKWLMGMDVKWKAYQITRPLRHMADLHLESAKAAYVCLALYRGAFAEAARQRSGAGEFDPTK